MAATVRPRRSSALASSSPASPEVGLSNLRNAEALSIAVPPNTNLITNESEDQESRGVVHIILFGVVHLHARVNQMDCDSFSPGMGSTYCRFISAVSPCRYEWTWAVNSSMVLPMKSS